MLGSVLLNTVKSDPILFLLSHNEYAVADGSDDKMVHHVGEKNF